MFSTMRKILVVSMLAMTLLVGGFFSSSGLAKAHANTPGKHTHTISVRPYVSGGGCTTQPRISACISENSSQTIVPDGYVRYATGCIKTVITLYINGVPDATYNWQPCQYHFTGPITQAQRGSKYFDYVTAFYNDGTFHAYSPTQYA